MRRFRSVRTAARNPAQACRTDRQNEGVAQRRRASSCLFTGEVQELHDGILQGTHFGICIGVALMIIAQQMQHTMDRQKREFTGI
jgi:hypothetical protein